MKIAMFTDTYEPQVNGVVTHIKETTNYLISNNHKVTLFVPGTKGFNIKKVSEYLDIVELYSIPVGIYEGYRIPIVNLKRINNIFKNDSFDIIHVHSPFISGIVGIYLSRRYSIPIIGTYHTLLPEYIPYLLRGNLQYILKKTGTYPIEKYTKHICSRFNIVISPSNEIKRYLESCGLKNVVYLPGGINPNELKNFEKINLSKEYGIPKDRKILLFVGRMGFEKRVDVLLKSMKYLEEERVFLVLVGSGPYLEKYKNIAKKLKLKNVKFLGYLNKEVLNSIYRYADIFVSPSDTETQGITFLEAMYFGLPLVGVNKGGVKDIIKNGINGFVVQPKDPKNLAGKIKKLTNNEEIIKKFSRNSKKLAKKYFINKTAKDLLRLYQKIL